MAIMVPILGVLGVVVTAFAGFFFRDVIVHRRQLEEETSFPLNVVFGFVADFFDTLGIGNFAPTTAFFRAFKQVQDRLIPGSLNVSHTIPVGLEALLFLTVIEVEIVTLVLMISAAVSGAVIGAGFVVGFRERSVRIVMGFALILTCLLMVSGQLGLIESFGTGEEVGLRGWRLAVGVAANFVLGALMTVGVGLYAPCMALVYLLGLNPLVAFPIMMGSCAFLMPFASYRFIRAGAYNRKASIGITFGGIFGVLVAVFIVKSLPLSMLTWLVIVVVFITAVTLLRSGFRSAER